MAQEGASADADASSDALPDAELRLEFDASIGAPIGAPPGAHDAACRVRALSWVDGAGGVLWTREVPARIREGWRGVCEELGDAARGPLRAFGSVEIGRLVTSDLVVLADRTGVLALDRATGAVRLDVEALDGTLTGPDLAATAPSFFFDEGRYEVPGLPACAGPASHGQLFVRCGDRHVFFNRTTALILSGAPLRVEARGAYAGASAYVPGTRPGEGSAEIAAPPYVLRLSGRSYLR